MKKEMLSVLSILMLMIGLLLGVSYAVNEERDSSGLFWVILFILLAIGLYLWLRRSERQESPAETALRKAQEAEDYAEDVFGRVKSAASSTAAPAAKQEASAPAAEAPKPAPEAKQAAPKAEEAPKPAPEAKQAAPKAEEAPKPAPLAPAPPAAVVPAEEKKPKAEKPAVKAEDMPTEPMPKPEIAEVEAAAVAKQAAAEAPTTEAKAAPASAEPDDLTLIEGIGPYYRDILHAAGITSFEALSKLDQKRIEEIAKDAGARRAASMATWPQQAALATKGDWAGLDALQSSLNAGRKS